MIENQAEKLSRFASSVNLEVDEKIQHIEKQALNEKLELLEKTEDRVLEEAFLKIQKAVRDTEGKYRKKIALKEQELRYKILKHREELSRRIFEAVENKIVGFTNSDQYALFLKKQLENENFDNAVIKMSERDFQKYGETIKKITGCILETDENIRLGGLTIYYKLKGIIVDMTLDSFFEEQKDGFSAKYNFEQNKS